MVTLRFGHAIETFKEIAIELGNALGELSAAVENCKTSSADTQRERMAFEGIMREYAARSQPEVGVAMLKGLQAYLDNPSKHVHHNSTVSLVADQRHNLESEQVHI